MNKNIWILSISQALTATSIVIIATISPLIGQEIAPTKELATLPIFIQYITITIITVPASYLMKQLHWRTGFLIGCLGGVLGILLSSLGLYQKNFIYFCLGSVGFGFMISFARYYRFAATDLAKNNFNTQAISYVLAGGIVAAVFAPELSKWSRGWFQTLYLGCYLVVTLLIILLAINLFLLDKKKANLHKEEIIIKNTPLEFSFSSKISLVTAVVAGMISYGVMIFLMSATPLAMKNHNHLFSSTAFVIQWHVLGMFSPSFFTGSFINRFGLLNVMLLGASLLVMCILVNLVGTTVFYFWLALLLLGVGWNFLFIGATTMITLIPKGTRKYKILATNEFLVSATTAICSLSSGAILFQYNWKIVNYVTIPFIAVLLLLLGWLKVKKISF